MISKKRDCGTCSACCRWPEIPELKKPRKVTCSLLAPCGHGCTRYPMRPRSCADYSCAWLEGYGEKVDQPDHAGVLITRRDSRFGMVFIAVDLGGPFRAKKKAIKRIARDAKMICLLVDDNNPEKVRFAYTPEGVEQVDELAPLEVV